MMAIIEDPTWKEDSSAPPRGGENYSSLGNAESGRAGTWSWEGVGEGTREELEEEE